MALGGSSHLVLHILPSSCSARLLKVITLFHQSTIPPVSARPVRRQKCVTQAARHISNPLTDEHYVFAACYNTTSSPIERTVLASLSKDTPVLLSGDVPHTQPLSDQDVHLLTICGLVLYCWDLKIYERAITPTYTKRQYILVCINVHTTQVSFVIFATRVSFALYNFFSLLYIFYRVVFFSSPPCHCQNVPVLSLDGWCAHPYYFFFVPPLIIF